MSRSVAAVAFGAHLSPHRGDTHGTLDHRNWGDPADRGTGRDSLPAASLAKLRNVASRNDVRAEIRQFLTTRRAKLTPEQAGLSTYGRNRRVPGLRREEVALLAGISIEYSTRLERGNARGVSFLDRRTAVTADPDT